MKYFSEITEQMYDTIEELSEAERQENEKREKELEREKEYNRDLIELKEAQEKYLDAFDAFCRKWNIKSSISSGTACISSSVSVTPSAAFVVCRTDGKYSRSCERHPQHSCRHITITN